MADFIVSLHLVPPDSQVLVAVSGGPDSCALFFSLLQNRKRLQIPRLGAIYVDHGFREAGPAEAAFVQKLALDNGAEFYTAKLNLTHGAADEERARNGRYALFEQIAKEHHFDLVALAHHADDVAETLLINLTRGTGPLGIKGMAPKRGLYIRPLLMERRQDILAYCEQLGITPVTDPTNLQCTYLRNRLRLKLLPLWQQLAERDIVPILNRNASILAADEDFLERYAQQVFTELLLDEKPLKLDLNKYLLQPVALQRRIARLAISQALGRYYQPSFAQVEEFIKVAQAGRGKLWLPDKLLLEISAGCLTIVSRETKTKEWQKQDVAETVCIKQPGYYTVGDSVLAVKEEGLSSLSNWPQEEIIALAGGLITWPLIVRPVRADEEMTLIGHKKKYRIGKILSDLKVPRDQRAKKMVLCDAGGKILWLIGHKRSGEALVEIGKTDSILLVTLKENKDIK